MKYLKVSVLVFISFLAYQSFGQVRIGIKLSPGISPVRTTVLSDTMTLNDEGSPLRMLAGLVVDYGMRDNYELRTGLNFISKKMSYDVIGDTPGVRYNDEIVMQYIQLPISLKLNTNEVMLDSKIYVQLGASIDIKIHDKISELTNPLVTKGGFLDTSMLFAAGMDKKLGSETTAFAGIVYQRAFLNQANETIRLDKEFKMQSAFIGLEIGVIF